MEIEFSKIINISGIDSLFELSHYKGDNIFVKSLKDNKMSVYSITRNKVMNLDNIQIYTNEELLSLKDLLLLLKNTTIEFPNEKSSKDDYYNFFLKICPNLDTQKVYLNNLKQILKWYNILSKHNIKY